MRGTSSRGSASTRATECAASFASWLPSERRAREARVARGGAVEFGSYSKTVCFDPATGHVLWKFKANGPISGSATIVDGVVYFATLKRRTYGLDARTGRQLWIFPDGEVQPCCG